MKEALVESGADVITVAVRRANLEDRGTGGSLLDHIDPKRYQLLPNTAAASTLRTPCVPLAWGVNSVFLIWSIRGVG